MTRSSNTERAQRLNAALELLARSHTLADAATALAREFGLSRRQAYRYLQEAQGIDGPVHVSLPTVPVTVKIPEDVAIRLRSYAQTSGVSIGEIVAQAVLSFLDKLRSHG
jgi:predicted DNA-binding transcriptional regulator YafY